MGYAPIRANSAPLFFLPSKQLQIVSFLRSDAYPWSIEQQPLYSNVAMYACRVFHPSDWLFSPGQWELNLRVSSRSSKLGWLLPLNFRQPTSPVCLDMKRNKVRLSHKLRALRRLMIFYYLRTACKATVMIILLCNRRERATVRSLARFSLP